MKNKILKFITKPKLAFQPIDPLGDGLREMIQREQASAESFDLHEEDYSNAGRFWQAMERDLHD